MIEPVARFYEDHPAFYAALTDGRPVAAQCRFIADHVAARPCAADGEPARLLELFAGPAVHTAGLAQLGFRTSAVDASPAMRHLAVDLGRAAPDSYHLCVLPDLADALVREAPFAGAFALIYSAGHLDLLGLADLVRHMADVVEPGGRLLLELHDPDLVRTDFRDLAIRERTIDLPDGGRLACTWPAGPLRWHPHDFVVEMEIALAHTPAGAGGDAMRSWRFRSTERIHTVAEVEAIAHALGTWIPVKVGDAPFSGSRLALLERRGG